MKEIWKDIQGYEGKYQVSNYGRVKSLIGTNQKPREKILTPGVNPQGYLHVSLCVNRRMKGYRVHRLVAEEFIPNPENKKEVNHIDGDKKNNTVDNLEWVTPKENMRHASINGLLNNKGKNNPMYGKTGSKCKNSKKVVCLTTNEVFESIKEAEEHYQTSRNCISSCLRNKQKTTTSKKTGQKLEWVYCIEQE